MKILFFGTPQIAVPYLEWLHKNHTVVGVVTKQDEPVGRGYKLTPPPVKVCAEKNNLPVFQPVGKWTEDKIKSLKDTGADVGVAVAYGRLMPEAVFKAPRLETFNIHFSLLPKYRGAAPMQWTLINGDELAGVTAFWIVKEMDAGPIFLKKSIPVQETDNALTLKQKLIDLGIEVLTEVMSNIEKGKISKENQPNEFTLAPQLTKEHGKIDWTKSATSLSHLIRGVVEWPGATTSFAPAGQSAKKLKILEAISVSGKKSSTPGEILEERKKEGLVVQTGEGQLLLKKVQPEGKKPMPALDFWRGARMKIGDRLG